MASSAHSEYLAKLPVDWEQVPVGTLGAVHAGGTPSRDIPKYWNGTIPWVTPAEITRLESKYLSKTNERITFEGLASCAAKLLPEGSLLVTTRATIGGVAVSKHPVCTNQGFKNIVLNEMSNVDFYYHLFSIIVPELSRLASGSTFPEINQRSFESIIVPRPSKDEQRRIAEILDTIDEAIQKTEALISKLKAMKQGLLHDLFTRGLDENGKLRDPKAHPEQFKDSPLGSIPKEWEIEQCQAVCKEIVVGIVIKPTQYYQSSGIAVLRSANIRESGIYPEDLVYMSEESNRLLAKSQIHTGNVLTVRTGYPGTSCVVPPEFDGANCVDLLISRPAPRILPEYLSLWINSPFGKAQVLRMQGGLAQQHFNVGELQKLIIPTPILREQSRIVKYVDSYNARIRTEAQYRDKLNLQKKGLMDDLLTGKVRVKV